MGGQLWVESELGRGSKFHFTACFGIQEGRRPEPEPVNVHGLPVLIVDDNATNRRILEEMLGNWRMRPTAVAGGWTALEELQRAAAAGEPFALVLLDAEMPEMDGFSLAGCIKGHPELAGATIMMLSSADRPGNAQRCQEAGITAYLMKPLKQSELLNTILTVLSRPRAAEADSHGQREEAVAGPSRHLRILLAEDNAVNQMLAVRLLERQGHAVTVADNGREAITALERQPFDMVLMDVQMPEMGGFEATARIREAEQKTGRHVPIIALTAHAMKGDRERCLAAGMDGYVAKPIKPVELFEVIDRVMAAASSPALAI